MWIEPIVTLLDSRELPAVLADALIELVEFFVMVIHASVAFVVWDAVRHVFA